MTLLITQNSFKKIQTFIDKHYILKSKIDFNLNEWIIVILTSIERDVEITYNFQFDKSDVIDGYEIFHNGFADDILQYEILNVIQNEIPDFSYIFKRPLHETAAFLNSYRHTEKNKEWQ